MTVEDFWDQNFATRRIDILNEDTEHRRWLEPVLSTALTHFGDVGGARLLDLGCGNGSSSLFFAKQGADVVSVDISEVAISDLSQFCLENKVNNITPIKCSAFDILNLGQFDFVFGTMILHHLEPFDTFNNILRKSMAPDGKAFFYENNAYSNLLVWFRNNLVGKYGIPKYGDDEEFPLTPMEIEMLRRNFTVDIAQPELVFLRLASWYLFRGHFEQLMKKLDDYFFQFHSLRKYSYWQYLLLS